MDVPAPDSDEGDKPTVNIADVVRKLQKDVAELWKLVLNIRATGGGGGGPHNLLSATHPDTAIAAVQRGDIITGQGSTPKWTRLGKGTAGQILRSDGTDINWASLSGVGGAPDDAEYIVGAADPDLLNERVKAALYDNYDPDDYPMAPDSLDDEFNDGALGVKWTVTNDPGTIDESAFPGFLLVDNIPNLAVAPDNFANLIRFAQAPPAGSDAWAIAAKVSMANLVASTGYGRYGGPGVYLADTVPAQKTFVACAFQMTATSTSGAANINAIRDNGSSVITSMTTAPALYLDTTEWMYIMLRKATANAYTNANTYEAWFSFNGIIWQMAGTCSKTFANTPAEIGLWIRKSDSQYIAAIIDWFRKVA
jgi:hypothetical protein